MAELFVMVKLSKDVCTDPNNTQESQQMLPSKSHLPICTIKHIQFVYAVGNVFVVTRFCVITNVCIATDVTIVTLLF